MHKQSVRLSVCLHLVLPTSLSPSLLPSLPTRCQIIPQLSLTMPHLEASVSLSLSLSLPLQAKIKNNSICLCVCACVCIYIYAPVLFLFYYCNTGIIIFVLLVDLLLCNFVDILYWNKRKKKKDICAGWNLYFIVSFFVFVFCYKQSIGITNIYFCIFEYMFQQKTLLLR